MSSGDPGSRIKSLKDYNGRTRYSIYLLNQLNRLKVPVEDHVNHFLSYQDEDTVDAFYEYHSDYTLATWTDVKDFCEKRQPHTVKPFILRVTEVMEARRLPDELPNSYYNRLLSILAFGDMKEATTLVTLKLLNELPLQVKKHFSDRSSNIDLTLALSEWKKFLDRSKLREHFNDSCSRKIFRQPPPTPVKLPNPSVTPDTKPMVVNPLKTSRPHDSPLPTPPATPRRSKDEITCFNCREKGHYASACPKRDPVMHKNNAIVSDQVFRMSPRVFEMITINGEYVKVLIDSGTTVNILPKSLIEQLHVTVVPTKDSIQYGGGYVATPHGESVLSMFFNSSESTYTAKFLITDDEYPMITMESALALKINYQERLQSMLSKRKKVATTLNDITDQSPTVAHSLITTQSLSDATAPTPTEQIKISSKIILSDKEPSLLSEDLSEYLTSTRSFYRGEGYERLNSPVYCPTANGLAEKTVGIVKTKFKHLTSKVIPFSKLMSYTLREINHQFRRSGETPAVKFYGMTAQLKLYKEILGLPEPIDPTLTYFKKSRKKQEFMLSTEYGMLLFYRNNSNTFLAAENIYEKNYVGIKHPTLWKNIYELYWQATSTVYKIKTRVNIALQELADGFTKEFYLQLSWTFAHT